ncbi:MAG: hypothetical protein ACTIOL_10815, partial [Enterococcus sp.]
MKRKAILFSTCLLFAVPLSPAMNVKAVMTEEVPITATQATWANTNNITFTDAFSLFNSGVAKLPLGKPVKVSATVSFSGDIEAIRQAQIAFENVGQGIQIDYDSILQFNENQKQAQFSFFITLIEP